MFSPFLVERNKKVLQLEQIVQHDFGKQAQRTYVSMQQKRHILSRKKKTTDERCCQGTRYTYYFIDQRPYVVQRVMSSASFRRDKVTYDIWYIVFVCCPFSSSSFLCFDLQKNRTGAIIKLTKQCYSSALEQDHFYLVRTVQFLLFFFFYNRHLFLFVHFTRAITIFMLYYFFRPGECCWARRARSLYATGNTQAA